MKKRLVALLFVIAMLFSALTACQTVQVVEPTRGVWDDHVYTSEYLGLRFVAFPGWNVSTDAEIAELMGMAAELFAEAGTELPEDAEEFVDMMVINALTGSNVQIIFERHGGRRAPTRENVIEAITEQLAEVDGRVTDIPGTTRIGAHDWYSFSTELDMAGMTVSGRQFFNIYEGYIRVIVITIMPGSDTLEDILEKFIGLNDPIPEFPEEEYADVLFGTWAWDEWDEYELTFQGDGQGIRGVPGQMESFEWRTEGDDHLVILTEVMEESWTFSVVGDVLTIDSRQVPGLTYSYIRQ